jgi:hypothetical protein
MKEVPPQHPPPYPDTLTVGRFRENRHVNLSALNASEKRKVWAHLQSEQPELAELLQDPQLAALRDAFDGEICIDREALNGLD